MQRRVEFGIIPEIATSLHLGRCADVTLARLRDHRGPRHKELRDLRSFRTAQASQDNAREHVDPWELVRRLPIPEEAQPIMESGAPPISRDWRSLRNCGFLFKKIPPSFIVCFTGLSVGFPTFHPELGP